MATGWAGDGAVQDQIDSTVDDAVKRARSQLPRGQSLVHCEECEARIPEARRKKISGTILISLSMNLDGTLGDMKVVQGLGAGLDDNALAAARQILFLPAIKEGAFVSVRNSVEFTFNLY